MKQKFFARIGQWITPPCIRKCLTSLKALTLLLVMGLSVNVWGTETALSESLDLTGKTVGSSAYNSSTTYGDWKIVNGANNNKGWAYFKMGGKSTTISSYNPCYIYYSANSGVSSKVDKITISIAAGSLSKSGMSVTSWGVYVYSDKAMTTQIDYVAGGTITKNAAIFDFTPSAGKTWAAGSYYKVSWDLANTTTTNGIVCVDKVTLYSISDAPAGPSLSVDPATIDFGTVYQNATIDAKQVEVTFANLTTNDVIAAISGSVFGINKNGSFTSGDKITITPSTADIGEYEETLTLSATGVDEQKVTVKMNVVAAPAPTGTFAKFTGGLTEGDYIICSGTTAMSNSVSSSRMTYTTVTTTNDKVENPDAALIWHIAPAATEGYWTIYNADAEKYAASTGAKNAIQLMATTTDDKALWETSGTYEFVNKQNKANSVNANLRYNSGYGFACYGTGTGGALTLYKKKSEGNVPVTGVSLPETAMIKTGGTQQLTPTFAPFDATNKNVTWEVIAGSDNIEVSDAGLVTAKAEGEGTVKVTTQDGGFTATCVVTVVNGIANTKETAYTVAQAIALYDAGFDLDATVYVKGVITSITGTNKNNIYIKDAGQSNSFEFFNLADGDAIVSSLTQYDTIIGHGQLDKFNSTYEFKKGCVLDERKAYVAPTVLIDPSNTPETAYTPAEAIDIYDNGAQYDLTKPVYVKGVVTSKPSMTTSGTWKGSYYQVEVAAAETTEPTFVFFHMFAGAASAQFTEDIVNAKDTLIAYGTLTKYNSTYELAERCYMYERKAYTPKVTGVTIDNKEGLTVPANESITLSATIAEAGAEGTLVWSVIAGSDKASVDAATGVVTGSAAGEATIQVQVQGTEFTDQCTVTVTAADLRKTATITSFEEKEGALTPNDITYVGEKGFAANATAVFNNNLRLYQNGGLVTIAAVKGCKIDEVIITTTGTYNSTTATLTTTRQASKPASGVTIAKSTEYSFGTGLNADSAFIYCLGTNNTARLEIASIVVKYTGEPAAVESLTLSGEYPTEFQKGAEFNHDGMVVTANYEGGDQVDVTANAEFSTPDMTTEGDQTVTVSFGGKSKDYTISILPAILEELVLSGEYQTIFQMGEEFNHTGMVVTAVYSDETEVTVTDEAIVSTPDMTVAGNKEVTVSYGGKETTYTISVKAQSGTMPKEKVDFTEEYANLETGTDLTQEAYNPYNGASFSLTYSKGTATSNMPKYYTSATQGQTVRAYEGNTITITAVDPILAIDVNFVSGHKDNGMTITYSNDNKTATLTFSGTCRFTDITVFYQFEEKARTGLYVGQIGTICQANNILAVKGVVLYNVEFGTTQEITLKEITEFPIAAGTPAIFQAETVDFEVIYGSQTATEAVEDETDGLVGLVQGDKQPIEENNVLVSGGKLRLVGADCYLTAGHAYIEMDEVSETAPTVPAPGRRLVLTNDEAQVITGLNAIQVSGKTRKMMINNQMVIIREGKMYNATGALMK